MWWVMGHFLGGSVGHGSQAVTHCLLWYEHICHVAVRCHPVSCVAPLYPECRTFSVDICPPDSSPDVYWVMTGRTWRDVPVVILIVIVFNRRVLSSVATFLIVRIVSGLILSRKRLQNTLTALYDCQLVTDARARLLRSADTRTLTVHRWHRTSSCFGDRTFAAAATRVWNSLPADLRKAELSYSLFRRSIKTFLFRQSDHGALWTFLFNCAL